MGNTTCSIDGCERAPRSRGMCEKHYQRWWATGDPLTPLRQGGRPSTASEVRPLWPTTLQECVEWTGRLDKGGYGTLRIEGVTTGIHRAVFMALTGTKPEVVRHTCDNPKCYRFEHLLPGTHADNTADRVVRGRGATGERHKGGRKRTAPFPTFALSERCAD